MLGKITRY